MVVAIIGVLATLLIPLASSARERASQVKCVGNLKQISTASAAYGSDNDGQWPPNQVGGVDKGAEIFANHLIPYLGIPPRRTSSRFRESPFVCPGDRFGLPNSSYQLNGVYTTGSSGYGLSYAQNSNLPQRRSSLESPSKIMAYMDFEDHYIANSGIIRAREERVPNLRSRHGGNLNAAFADGSVRTVRIDELLSKDPPPFW